MNTERLDELASAHLDAQLTPEEAAELAGMLRENPAARRRFLLVCDQDATLRGPARATRQAEPAAKVPARAPHADAPRGRRRWPTWAPLAAAACVLVGLTLYIAVLHSRGADPVARIEAGRVVFVAAAGEIGGPGPVLIRDAGRGAERQDLREKAVLYVGDRIVTGRTPGGSEKPKERRPANVALELSNGVKVELADATEVGLIEDEAAPGALELTEGLLYAETGTNEKGHVLIRTPWADLTAANATFEVLCGPSSTRAQLVSGTADFGPAGTTRELKAGDVCIAAKATGVSVPAPSATGVWRGRANLTQLSSGLVAHWRFDENTGTSAADASGHGHALALRGATWAQGRSGSALRFDGNGASAVSADVADLHFSIEQSFTLTAWAYVDAMPTDWTGVATCGRQARWYGIWLSPQGRWAFCGPLNILGPDATPGWHFLAAVQDTAAGKRILYVDGKAVNTGQVFDARAPGGVIVGGAAGIDSGMPFSGRVDEVRIYARALSPDELQDLRSEAPAK